MAFRITGLDSSDFEHLWGLDEAALHAQRARRMTARSCPGYPDRITLREGEVGDTFLLVHHCHQRANSPYRASHAIFVSEGKAETFDATNTIPEVMQTRLISLRAFDDTGMMVGCNVAEGPTLPAEIESLLTLPGSAYLHAHFAKAGCYAALIRPA